MKNPIGVANNKIIVLQAEAKNSRDKLRSFNESSCVIHLLLDTKMRLIDFNSAAARFMKKNHSTAIRAGSLITDFMHENQVSSVLHNYKKALKGKSSRTNLDLQYQDSVITWFITYEPAFDCDKNLLGVTIDAIDITEKLENERRIASQNHSLQEIAYIQSHNLRRPVSNIIGVMNILSQNGSKCNKAGFAMLQQAINELEFEMLKIEKFSVPK